MIPNWDLSGAPATSVRGGFFRIVHAAYAPFVADAGESLEHGGRYNRPRGFAALYLGDSESTCWRELARKAGSLNMLPESSVGVFDVLLTKVLDLTDADLAKRLGISVDRLLDPLDYSYSRSIAAAAREAGFEGLLVPSATGEGKVLAVFVDRMNEGSRVELTKQSKQEPPDAS